MKFMLIVYYSTFAIVHLQPYPTLEACIEDGKQIAEYSRMSVVKCIAVEENE